MGYVEHTTIRVPFYGDGQIYPTIRHLGLHACSIAGLSSSSVDYPLGQLPNLRALSLSGGAPVIPQPFTPPPVPYLISDPTWDNPIPTEKLTNLFSSFSTSLQILSLDASHSKSLLNPTSQIPLSYLRALDLTPSSNPERTFSLALPLPPPIRSRPSDFRLRNTSSTLSALSFLTKHTGSSTAFEQSRYYPSDRLNISGSTI
ncbi:hypothetical protein BCR35DRAFT_334877 [Leucosporidium creatinivorum]|uniref:Uncharacterized protein n=1 Tax=Leucosporidium creatinivorum TaxID=106004 RepID=A0A1Y2DTY7_9BASI|nr:hypothetical protein BCR35DRAFT_334877 [Leucosporidium creatinivorum]